MRASLSPPPFKKKAKQTHVLPSYGHVSDKFNKTPLLDKVSPWNQPSPQGPEIKWDPPNQIP